MIALTRMECEAEGHAEVLARSPHERKGCGADLNEAVAERDERIRALEEECARKEKMIEQQRIALIQNSFRLQQNRASLVWKLFWPLRIVQGLVNRLCRSIGVHLVPFDNVQRDRSTWVSTGRDASFLLLAERAWPGLAGWYWLVVDSASAQPRRARLLFDTGGGFDPSRLIELQFTRKGRQRIPFCVPPGCRAIRLDALDVSGEFALAVSALRRLTAAPPLPPEYQRQITAYEALGEKRGNAVNLEPANGIRSHGAADYTWQSEGDDPWFVVRGIDRKLRRGWYMVEVRIHAEVGRSNATVYFDQGSGYCESNKVSLPFSSGQLVKRLYYLEAEPVQVRFDPLEQTARFSVERLHLAPVAPIFARARMLRRLRNRIECYRDYSIIRVWKDVRQQARKKNIAAAALLYDKYNRTFHVNGPQGAANYAEWVARKEMPESGAPAAIRDVREALIYKPTVSVVMPVYNTAETFLRKAIESVLAQSYPFWELCVADDASDLPHVREVLEEYVRRDSRIKVTYRRENGHISAASNSALECATGDYVALLDHDDELAPHALHHVAVEINRNRAAQILYSDEDKISEEGIRSEPHFKPDWSPDMFFSQNYVSHLGVYRRELLRKIGGFRRGVEGSQDQDLLLRCLPQVKPAEIVHIPKVLYHWRTVEGSTARASGEKSYTTAAGINALKDYFREQGREDVQVVAGAIPNTYRVRYPIPQREPLVSLLIPTRDTLEMLAPCLRSIIDKTTYQNYEIIVLDNESTEAPTIEFYRTIQAENSRVRVLPYHHTFNYSAINNYGVRHARGELIGLINNDVEIISPGWLSEMVSHALRPEIGCVGAKLYYENDSIQHAGVILGINGVANHAHKHFPGSAPGYFNRLKIIHNVSAVTAACLVVRKAIYEAVGGLEEIGLRVAFNDVDFCLKVREAGYRNLWTPYAELYHHESASRGSDDSPGKVERFKSEVRYMQNKWGSVLRHDPYYNPNLSLTSVDFSLGGSEVDIPDDKS